MRARRALPLVAAALCFVWLHACTVPRTLLDEDAINLAMGVESFNVARYAPHPPGYPVYIALGKVSTAAVTWLRPDWPRDRRAAAGLAWLSILSGALGIFAFAALWRGLGVSPGWATLAAMATAAAPLYWFTAARPLTDTPGLVAAVAIQAAFLHGLRQARGQSTLPASWVAAAVAAGLAIGLRSQTMWLTLPIFGWVLIVLLRRRRWMHGAMLSGAAVAGVLIWFVPLVQMTGGFDQYWSLLRGQGRHDFTSVRMLATHASWGSLREDLAQTFLAPWQLTAVPWVVVGAAALGLLRLAGERERRLALLGVLVVPYLTFHVLFHEVETIRYALPVVSMVAGLAVIALAFLNDDAGGAAAIVATIATVAAVHPVTATYAGGAPAFQVMEDLRIAHFAGETPRLEAHHRAWWATSRALDWNRTQWDVEAPRLITRDESLRLVDYWRSGAMEPIWFLSDPDREDLARFDPAAVTEDRTYRLSPAVASLVGGLRPYDVGSRRLLPPAWMLGRGWSITRELAHEAAEPHRAVAYLRRQPGEAMLLVGARHLEIDPSPVEIVARLDGREVDRWQIDPGEGFARWIILPDGALDGDSAYAPLVLSVPRAGGHGPENLVAFDQFNASFEPAPMVAVGRGWSAIEHDPGGRSAWRTSRLSELEVRHAGRPLRLTIRGEVPAGDFATPPSVLIFAGQALLADLIPDSEFELSFDLLPDVIDAAGGTITLSVDLRRTLDERRRGVPPREFGLRVTDIEITDAEIALVEVAEGASP